MVVIFITANADMEKAVRAIKEGATDFIPKPWEREKLLATVASAVELRKSSHEVSQLKQQVAALESNRAYEIGKLTACNECCGACTDLQPIVLRTMLDSLQQLTSSYGIFFSFKVA